MHDVAREVACAVISTETISANVLKEARKGFVLHGACVIYNTITKMHASAEWIKIQAQQKLNAA